MTLAKPAQFAVHWEVSEINNFQISPLRKVQIFYCSAQEKTTNGSASLALLGTTQLHSVPVCRRCVVYSPMTSFPSILTQQASGYTWNAPSTSLPSLVFLHLLVCYSSPLLPNNTSLKVPIHFLCIQCTRSGACVVCTASVGLRKQNALPCRRGTTNHTSSSVFCKRYPNVACRVNMWPLHINHNPTNRTLSPNLEQVAWRPTPREFKVVLVPIQKRSVNWRH